MGRFQIPHRIPAGALKGRRFIPCGRNSDVDLVLEGCGFSRTVRYAKSTPALAAEGGPSLRHERGSALLEFAIALPLLVVFVVGIYDFSGAFNQKQKIEQAAQEGAILAGAQPTSDIATTTGDPASLHPVVTAVFNSLVGSGVLPSGTCTPPGTAAGPTGLAWTYTISGCPDQLVVIINRGTAITSVSPAVVGTVVTVEYPYHWRFNRVIQLLIPGASYAATTQVSESATVHNQM